MTIKAQRVGESAQQISAQDLKQGMLDSAALVFDRDDAVVATGISDRIMAQHKWSGTQPSETVILEWVVFHPSLPEEDLDLLNERIALLCALLRSAGHPYFPALPLCSGFFRQSRTSFALVYQLPPFAAPSQPPRSLYSLLPRNKYSVLTEKQPTGSGSSSNNNAAALTFSRAALRTSRRPRRRRALASECRLDTQDHHQPQRRTLPIFAGR